jgi:uroporphyrinogen-III synthase
MKLLIIRPQPGNDASAARACDAGFEPLQLPLFAIASRPWDAPDQRHYDALLFTSANAVRHAGPALQNYQALPVHAVGSQTATALRYLGIDAATTGTGDASVALLNAAKLGHRHMLWLAGEDHIDLTPPPGGNIETRICYAAEALSLSAEAGIRIASADIVAFHSARAAIHFCETLSQFGLDRANLVAAAFSPAIAAAAGAGWRAMAVARQPTDSALLSAVAELVKRAAVATEDKEDS